MNKKGGLLKLIIIVIIALLLIIAGVVFYFYNFYVFKTVKVCIGDAVNTDIPCNASQDCVDVLIVDEIKSGLDGAPEFIQKKFGNVIDDILYCETTCFVKNVSGINYKTGELEMINKCESGEVEIKMEIRGKEGIEVLRWIQEQKK